MACAAHGIRTCVLERVRSSHQGGAALGVERALLLRVTGTGSSNFKTDSTFPPLTAYRHAASWQALYGWLRSKILDRPEITLLFGTDVVRVEQSEKGAAAITQDGRRIHAPVVIGADGAQSIVRRSVNPEQPGGVYAGYLLWRGLIPEQNVPDVPWPRSNDGVALVTSSGYRLVAYPVSTCSGSLDPGHRSISFSWYDASRGALLQELGCLSPTGEVLSSLVPQRIPATVRSELRNLAEQIWPDPWRAAIVHALDDMKVFATPVAEYLPTRLYSGRIAIIGDAAHVSSPVVGRGFAAGTLDAEVLAVCLDSAFEQAEPDIPAALKRYEDARLPDAREMVSASMRWSQGFVGSGPNSR